MFSLALSARLAAAASPPGAAEFELCQACHGVRGQGTPALLAPRIAGQRAEYLRRQLEQFRAGVRGGPGSGDPGLQMAEMAKVLPDAAAVARVAAYVEQLPEVAPAPLKEGRTGDASAGRLLAVGCLACHGAAGEGGVTLGAPRLAGMSPWYLVRQLEDFRVGRRGGEGAPAEAQTMRAMALGLPEGASLDVAAAMASLPGKPSAAGSAAPCAGEVGPAADGGVRCRE